MAAMLDEAEEKYFDNVIQNGGDIFAHSFLNIYLLLF
jgi:hypothetical protein